MNYEPAKLWSGKGYQTDKNLLFWHKWRLYKRLESSLYAFYKSIRNLKERFQVYRMALEKSSDLDSPLVPMDIKKHKNIVDENRYRVVLRAFKKLNEDLRRQVVFNLREDCKLLDAMVDNLKDVFGDLDIFPYDDDQKTENLKDILKINMEEGKPSIVFSEFADTVDYLYNSLKDEFEKIDYIHGLSGKSSDKIIERFQDGEIDIIITTDILAEGLNIPRADCIINFDLPYNPVKLIHRAGRALRISNPKKIYLRNFKPDKEIDNQLDLIDKLDLRLNTMLNVVGLDFVVWMMDEKKIEEWHEEEKEEYLELYSQYKEKVATTNPDDLISSTVPEESHLDKILRKAVKHYNINQELIKGSGVTEKTIYTVLKGEEGLFLIATSGWINKLVNKLQTSVVGIDDPSKINVLSSDQTEIQTLLEKAEEEMNIEIISKRKLKRKQKLLGDKILKISERLSDLEMKRVLRKTRRQIESETLLPHELESIEKAIDDILDYPRIFKNIDEQIKTTDSWKYLTEISEKTTPRKGLRLLGFIKYVGD